MLAEVLRQRGTFRIRKDACRKRLKHWATVFFFIPSFTVNSVLSSAIGAEKNSLQGKIVDDFEALKATVPEVLASVTNASIRGFYRLAVRMLILLVCIMGRKSLNTTYIDHISRRNTSQSGELVSLWTA